MNTEPFSLPLAPRKHHALLHDYLEQLMPTSELGLHHNLTLAQIKEWLDHPQTRDDIALLQSLIEQRAAHALPHLLENALQNLHRLSLIGPGSKQLPEEIRQGEACRKATSALLKALQPPKARSPISSASHPNASTPVQAAGKPLAQTHPHEANAQQKPQQTPLQKCVQSQQSSTQPGQLSPQTQEIRADHALPDRPDTRPQTRIMGRERERPRHRLPDPEPALCRDGDTPR